MSRKLLAILLAELKLVRAICPHSKTAIEMPIEDIGRHLVDTRCPVCQKGWGGLATAGGPNRLTQLAQAIKSLQGREVPEIEFVLPDASDGDGGTKAK